MPPPSAQERRSASGVHVWMGSMGRASGGRCSELLHAGVARHDCGWARHTQTPQLAWPSLQCVQQPATSSQQPAVSSLQHVSQHGRQVRRATKTSASHQPQLTCGSMSSAASNLSAARLNRRAPSAASPVGKWRLRGGAVSGRPCATLGSRCSSAAGCCAGAAALGPTWRPANLITCAAAGG